MFTNSLGPVNMFYTNEADFRQDIKWKILHIKVHQSVILF